jgi:hypothetical protein
MTPGGMDRATLVLLGLEEQLWEDTEPGERLAYHAATACFLAFLAISLATSVILVHLVVSSWWIAVPAGAVLSAIIASVVRFSLIILRRSIFDPLSADPAPPGTEATTPPAASIDTPQPPAATPGDGGIQGKLAQWRKILGQKTGLRPPGMAFIIRMLIVSMMGLLVALPLAILLDYEAIEALNRDRRSTLLARYENDERGSLGARTAWMQARIGQLEKDLTMNQGRYRTDGLLKEKTAELEALRVAYQQESQAIEADLARITENYRQRLERSQFLMHSVRAAASTSGFLPSMAIVAALLAIPHLLLSRLRSKGGESYAERSTRHYRSIIDEEYARTEDAGYARLLQRYGYDPVEFKRNIHWENTPYNTIPRRIFEDRKPMDREAFEAATGTQNP